MAFIHFGEISKLKLVSKYPRVSESKKVINNSIKTHQGRQEPMLANVNVIFSFALLTTQRKLGHRPQNNCVANCCQIAADSVTNDRRQTADGRNTTYHKRDR